MSFAEKFCAQRNVHPEEYCDAVLRLTLRPSAKVLRPVLALNPNYFAADREFINAVGRISQLAQFDSESEDFAHNPYGRGFCHRVLRLRVSRRQLRNLVREVLAK